ncbi:sugar ABC transporter permease [Clostridium sp. AL.422]|uniref:sugar ABC transporter permease n=1 Tax=Clostridium TaxID=1485 RepID=UPI00293DA825|nr:MULTISPECIES: sugar ABC transporter permease [unclassified Clostridium]MDV4151385.1 sugar ABC transporter permease [Clostridium sp. AL.422]
MLEINLKKNKNKNKTLWKQIKKHKAIYIMMAPIILYFSVFSYYPLILGLIQSFQKNKLIGTAEFSGLSNYKEVLSDYRFGQAFNNSIIIGVGTLLATFVCAVVLSISINEIRNKKIKTTMQTVTYLPYLFSWTVVGGLWVFILSYNGMLNGILSIFNIEATHFLSELKNSQSIMILTSVWKNIGYYAVLLLASIVTINPSIFEAAQIDGATRFKQIKSIIIPQIIPTMKVIIVLGTMGLLRNFDQIFVMGNPTIMDKVRTLLLYIYEEGILQFKVGKATAAATIVLISTFIITAIVRKVIKYDDNY